MTKPATVSGAQATHARFVGAGPALLMVAAVLVAAFIAFAHRPQPPFADTQIYPDKILLTSVAAEGTRLVAVGELGRILVADAPAGPWREAVVKPQRGSTFTQVRSFGNGVLIAVGHDGWIVRSVDHGATWKEVAFNTPAPDGAGGALGPDPFATADAPAESSPADAAAPAEAAPAEGAAAPAQSDPILGLAGPFDDKLFAIGAFGLFLVSTDQGQTWTREVHETIGDRHLNAMARAGDGSLIVVGERGLMARSTDLGANWTLLPDIYSGSFYGLLTPAPDDLVAFGMRGNVFVSRDSGKTWVKSEVPLQQSLFGGAVGDDGSIILAGAANTIVASSDGGAHFSLVSKKDRSLLSSLVPLGKNQLLTVGDGGIRVQAVTGETK
jgi:photosystem II stability/assembly factor-like uncharacterized protein